MQENSESKQDLLLEDEAMAEIFQENENIPSTYKEMTSVEAIRLMEEENLKIDKQGYRADSYSKKQVTQILSIIEKTEVLMGDFFQKLAKVNNQFDNVAKAFFKNANEIADSVKNPTEEQKRQVLINVACGVMVKGIGALWKSLQTERQFREIIHIYAQEAAEKMLYVGMLIQWLDVATNISFVRLLRSSDIDSAVTNLDLYRGLHHSFDLARYLYSVYDASLSGNFTNVAYPTMFDVNKSLISQLANIEKKDTEAEQIESNRVELRNVANRIRSVMNGELEEPTLIDVLIASDDTLMATAIHMGMPGPDSFRDEEIDSEPTPHFPFEDLDMLPESLDHVTNFISLKGCGNCHQIAEKIEANDSVDRVMNYVEELENNQKQYDARRNLYGINCWLLAAVTFMLFWDLWDWKWYWSLLMALVMFIMGVKILPFSNLRQISRHRAILMERELITSTKELGGYTEVIYFYKLRRKNNNVFLGAIIGGIIGCILAGPLGLVPGVLLGSLIGWAIKSYKTENEDWRNVSIGNGVWAKIWCGALSVSLLLLIYNWLF